MAPKKRQRLEVQVMNMLEEQQRMQRQLLEALNTIMNMTAWALQQLQQQHVVLLPGGPDGPRGPPPAPPPAGQPPFTPKG